MKLDAAMEAFLDSLADEHLRSPHTVKLYRQTLGAFRSGLKDNPPVRRLRRDHVRVFLVRMRDEEGNGPATLRAKVAALRSFFHFLVDRRHLKHPPFSRQDFRIRVPKKVVSVLTQEELHRLLVSTQATPKAKTRPPRGCARGLPVELRDRALVFLLAACGLRVGEATMIQLAHIDRRRKVLRVQGKGGHQREVFYDVDPLRRHLEDYFDARKRIGLVDGSLFVNFRDGRRITSRGVQLIIKKYSRMAGIEKDVTPHTLRHTYATLSIERGANVKAIAQILGHASVQTTINTYTHLSEAHVRDVFRLCHPLQDKRLPLEDRVEARKRSLPLIS